jgi:hypothetical protein
MSRPHRSDSPNRYRSIAMCWLGLCLCLMSDAIVGQTTPPRTGSAESTSTDSPGTEPSRETKPRPTAPEAAIPADGIPAFHLARLALAGQVEGDRALMTAQIDVDVNRDQGGYHDVPLRFQQAHVLKKAYQGPGREGPMVDVPVEDGIVWRFSGYGTHHLTLTMWVPIKESPAGRQLVLSLPTMPPGFDAQIELTIPGARVALRGSRELTILSHEVETDRNRITANVRGPRLDLTWSEPPEVQTAFRQVNSSFTLHRAGDRVIAQSKQDLIPENASVKAAIVKLPQEFELEELTGALLKSQEPIADRPGWRKLTFREGGGERIELNWVLAAPFAAEGGTLVFDGLTVEEARNQSGQIRLQEFPGYQMVPRPGQFVRRAPASTPQAAEVFEYTKQPFHIEWAVQKVVPKFSTRSRSVLFVGGTQLSLDQKIQFQTDAGSIEEIELLWPDAVTQGWRLDPASISGDAFIPADGNRLSREGKLRVQWKSPRTGAFELAVRFSHVLDVNQSSVKLQLPAISGARSMPSDLLVAAEDQFDVTVQDVQNNVLPPTSVDSQKLVGTPSNLASQVRQHLVLPVDQPIVNLNWKTQSRVVEAETEIELRRATSGRVRIQQAVLYQIRFGRVSRVQLELPKSLSSLFEPGTAAVVIAVDGVEVVPQIREGTVTIPFADPRVGPVKVTLDYSLPLSSPAIPTVPVLTSLDATYSAIRTRVPEGEPLRISPTATEWQPVPTAPDALVWVSKSASQIPILLDTGQAAAPRFSIDLASYRTRYDALGHIEGVCEFHWSGGVRTLPITLPPDSELLAVRCNGVNLTAAAGQIQFDPEHPEQISIRLPTSIEGTRLAILYRSLKELKFSQRDLRSVRLPALPPDASIVHSQWELELPPGRHLFIGPSDLTPEQCWQRSGLFWSRQPLAKYVQGRQKSFVEAAELTALSDSSNVYAYSSIGRIETPRFQSMGRSLILLLGAGLTLTMGFLFWNLPATRNMLTLLLVAFGVSLLSLWFLEPIQLLLQPAILGIVLAILASLVDFKSRRQTAIFLPPAIPGTLSPPVMSSQPPSQNYEAPSPARGSSVSRPPSHPIAQTALYQPHPSEVRGS